MSESTPSHPRPRELEAFVAGEPGTAVEAHLPDCVGCRRRVAALEQEREHQLARVPAQVFLARLAGRRREHAQRARRRNIVLATIASGLGVATAAAAGLAVIHLGPLGPLSPPARGTDRADGPGEPTTLGDTRLKGTSIQIFRKRGEQVVPLGADDRIRAGDGLRIALTLARPERVSLWFVDRTGRVDPYPPYPDDDRSGALPGRAPGEHAPLLAAGYTVLPGAVVVDAPCVDMRLIVQTSAGQLERALRCE